MNFKKMTFLCMQKLTNFPYIEADFDALTNYELLSKVVEYLNKVIANENAQNEALNELATGFNNLKDYVDNYFDNLDVQEEINNKLDEMAESGQLTDIIAQYLGLAGMIAFDTVADMKEAENLVNGSKCRTLGFHSANDGGGSYYKIRTVTNDDVIDEKTIIAVYDDLLVAELVTDKTINVKQLGAYGDNTHDDYDSIQTALNKFSDVFIPDGTYLVDVHGASTLAESINGGLKPKSNQKIVLSNNAKIKAIPNSYDYYRVINVHHVDNVKISGGYIIGDKDDHLTTPTEYGHAIGVHESTNVLIENCDVSKGIGDSICILADNQSLETYCENVVINNCKLHDSRRQGISVIALHNGTVSNNEIYNISGTNPQSGIDIEPNYETNPAVDIKILNNNIHDTTGQNILITQYANNVLVDGNTLDNTLTVLENNTDVNVSNSKLNKIIVTGITNVDNCNIDGIIQADKNGKIFIKNSNIYAQMAQLNDTSNYSSSISIKNSNIDFNSSTATWLFAVRTNNELILHNNYIKHNVSLSGGTRGKYVEAINNIFDVQADQRGGFITEKLFFKNNIVKTNRLYEVGSLSDSTETSYFVNNIFEVKPVQVIRSGQVDLTQPLFVLGNISPTALTIKSVDRTYAKLLAEDNYINVT